ncbi:OmpA family protein [Rhodoferax sp.]|uniref:OmpA family protein n=1 Tax=Rhodoferax sp. TaxID=50421 RepID=UPI0028450FCE|nr:OmpA family protein [Rhodoferax sp.]MDR3369633.1 OmpA family protein [Rhodoferax sp.]
MTNHQKLPSNKRPAKFLAMALLLALAGCAKNYVVLLPDDDGTVGKVQLTSRLGTTVLDKSHQGSFIRAIEGRTFTVDDDTLKTDFGAALAASPTQAARYILYFDTGQSTLTTASQADLEKIKLDLQGRQGADISVIGHTDTVGDPQANAALGLTRAKQVAAMIDTAVINAERVSILSYGEKNLLVPTPDDTDEPRNRGVEVIVR